jgi:hypothetical protein
MENYRFHLQKYRPGSKTCCPACGRKQCFTRYVDDEGIVTFPDNVGICDHINSCGYHYAPKAYFNDHPDVDSSSGMDRFQVIPSRRKPVEPVSPSYISRDIMEQTMTSYETNPLFLYLSGIWGKAKTGQLMTRYNVGTSKKWGGSAVFWQVDIAGNVRTGKIMLYDSCTGHRVKEPHSYVGWVHSELKLPDFHLKQCLFGEHLLAKSPTMPIGIVESEKTAIICSAFVPDILWLATGGMNGCFNAETMSVLRDRNVTLFPDLGAYEIWSQKASILSGICQRVVVSDLLEKNATDEQRSRGLDLSDFFLEEPTKRQILQSMIQRFPVLQQLIDDLELELIE